MDPRPDTASAMRRKVFALADEYGLDRDDRIHLAEYLLRRDVNTFLDLTDAEIGRVLDAFEGFFLIGQLILQGQPAGVQANTASTA